MALVKTELYLRVLGKRFKDDLCVSIECLLGFVFFLNWVFFSDLGYPFSFVSHP